MAIRQTLSRPVPLQVAGTIEAHVGADIAMVFDFVAAEDVLPKVLTGYGLVPAVVRTSGNSGPWDAPGSIRTVHLAGVTTAREPGAPAPLGEGAGG